MKKKVIALMAIVAVFGLAIAAYAYTQAITNDNKAKASCCKKSDSCPMKNHGGEHAKMEGHASCDDCCNDSCPMKKGETAATAGSDGKNCCDACDCCGGKHETVS